MKSFFQSVARGSVLFTRGLRIGGLERPVPEANTLVAPDGSLYGYMTMMLGGRWTLSAFKTKVCMYVCMYVWVYSSSSDGTGYRLIIVKSFYSGGER